MAIPYLLACLYLALGAKLPKKYWEQNIYRLLTLSILLCPVLLFSFQESKMQSLIASSQSFLSWMALIGSIYIVCGGIKIDFPWRLSLKNNLFLLLCFSFVSLLSHPYLSACLFVRPFFTFNQKRKHQSHLFPFYMIAVVFLPLAFLGEIRFSLFHFLDHLSTYQNIFLSSLGKVFLYFAPLYLSFLFIEALQLKKEDSYAHENHPPVKRIRGRYNLIFLLGILMGSLFESPYRESIMISMAGCSLMISRPQVQQENSFDFKALLETILFFLTLAILAVPFIRFTESWTMDENLKNVLLSPWVAQKDYLNTKIELSYLDLKSLPFNLLILFSSLTYLGNPLTWMLKANLESLHLPSNSFLGYLLYSLLYMSPILIMILLFHSF